MPSTCSHLQVFNFPSSKVWSPVYPSKYFSCKVLINHLLLFYAITAIHICPLRFVKYSWLDQHGFELHGTTYSQFFFNSQYCSATHRWLNPGGRSLVTEETWISGPTTSYTRILGDRTPNPGIVHRSTVFTCFFTHHNKLDTRNHILCRTACLAQVLRVFIYLIIIC